MRAKVAATQYSCRQLRSAGSRKEIAKSATPRPRRPKRAAWALPYCTARGVMSSFRLRPTPGAPSCQSRGCCDDDEQRAPLAHPSRPSAAVFRYVFAFFFFLLPSLQISNFSIPNTPGRRCHYIVPPREPRIHALTHVTLTCAQQCRMPAGIQSRSGRG